MRDDFALLKYGTMSAFDRDRKDGGSSMKVAHFLLAITCIASGAVQAGAPTPEILVTALRGTQWQVRYDFAQPVDKLEFKSSPDDSRGRTWLPDQGFEIVSTDRGEVARRKDGAHFRTVRFRMSPTYSVLPKEYAPFSPFGGNGKSVWCVEGLTTSR